MQHKTIFSLSKITKYARYLQISAKLCFDINSAKLMTQRCRKAYFYGKSGSQGEGGVWGVVLLFSFLFWEPCSGWSQLSMNPRPNITSYPVCMEDGGGNGGKSGFG